jgi:hypothetical protein
VRFGSRSSACVSVRNDVVCMTGHLVPRSSSMIGAFRARRSRVDVEAGMRGFWPYWSEPWMVARF